ncbi:MAG TPA: RNA polymerase sigma factor [Solirubrobacterales bacterium]|nr:RNA polymerase sigma factor [Solirubrobacterales bacterium]
MSHADPTSLPERSFRTVRLASDERLAKRAAAGDERAFAAIYQRYRQDLYRFCLAIVRDPQDAQDALQNAMVKVLRALPGETRQIQLKPWLYRIAHNEAVETLRRRRDNTELDPEVMGSGDDPSETAATRERLRRLFADLVELPERQRSALVMRELSGLGFEEIGEAFDTSPAVARQTVYEARLGLRQMEAGREMRCRSVMWDLSEADGRVARRRDIQAHLRACPECRAFAEEVTKRRNDFAALAPLPLAVSAGLLQGLLSGGASSAGAGAGGSLAGAATVGVGKSAAISTGMKAAATVAIAAVGVTAADRSGVIETPLPSSIGGAKSSGPEPGTGGAGETPGQSDRSDPPPARVVDSTAGTPKPAIGPGGEAGQRSVGSAQPPAQPSDSGELVQAPAEPSSNGRGHSKGNKGKGGNEGGRSSDLPAKSGHEKNAPKKTGKPPSPPKGNPPPGSTKAKTKGNSSPPIDPPGTEVEADKGAGDTFQPSKPEVKGASSGSAEPSKEAR